MLFVRGYLIFTTVFVLWASPRSVSPSMSPVEKDSVDPARSPVVRDSWKLTAPREMMPVDEVTRSQRLRARLEWFHKLGQWYWAR